MYLPRAACILGWGRGLMEVRVNNDSSTDPKTDSISSFRFNSQGDTYPV